MIKEENSSSQSYFIEDENDQESFFSLRTILDFLIGRWYWFLVSIIVCLTLMRVYISTIQPLYQHQTMVMIKSDDKSGVSDEMSEFLELNGRGTKSMVENELYVLRSTPLLEEVVRRLHLDVDYQKKLLMRRHSLFDDSPIIVNFLDKVSSSPSFCVSPLNAKTCEITDVFLNQESVSFSKKVNYGEIVKTPFGRITITPNKTHGNSFEEDIYVSRSSVNAAALRYKEKLTTELLDETSLVTISCTDGNVNRADSVLAKLVEVYSQYTIDDKNRVAQSTEEFVQKRIQMLAQELGVVDTKLAAIKSSNKILDFKTGGTQFLAENAKAKDATLDLETQVLVANYVSDYMSNSSMDNQLIPELGGLDQLAASSQIADYNNLMLERNRLAQYSSAEASVVSNMDRSLQTLRSTIKKSLDANIKSLKIRLQRARHQESLTDAGVASIPAQERLALDAGRQQLIKESLYSFLLNKREENAIKLAITESNVRLVEPPYGSPEMVSPKRGMMMLAAFAIGLVIPFALLYLFSLIDTKVRGRKDIEDNTSLPVLGEIPSLGDDEDMNVQEKDNDHLSESFRLARANLNFIDNAAKVLVFTS
ncbi:MAG: GNVR domain-containing protein, partial [Bacteroidaceae bacterium]